MIHAVAQEVITLKDVEISPGSGVKHQSLSSSGITHQFPLSSIKHQSASSSGIQEPEFKKQCSSLSVFFLAWL
jgi:hypothetical protein